MGDPKNVNDLLRAGAHRAAAILVQMSVQDAEESVNSGKQMENGATLRVTLALRNTIFTHAEHGNLNPNLRIVLHMVKIYFCPFFLICLFHFVSACLFHEFRICVAKE